MNSLFLTLTNTKFDDTVSSDCIEPDAPVDIAPKKGFKFSALSPVPVKEFPKPPEPAEALSALALIIATPTSGKNLP